MQVAWRTGFILLAALSTASPDGWRSGEVKAYRASLRPAELPDRLSDRAFWRLSADTSEPGGYFRSQDITNLTSNEIGFQYVIPDLQKQTRTGGVYLGVGPEQNFTYIAATRPRMAIILDIRRGNLNLHLMYKALFELAADRAEFVAMLFGTPRPSVSTASSAADLFRALAAASPSNALHRQYVAAIEDRLLRGHELPLSAGDLNGIRQIYRTFFYNGVAVRPYPTYEELMTATDRAGVNHSFLADEASFAVVKDLQSRNLVVPVVGDFSGARALRGVGAYLRSQGATVSAFYLSNVEQYLYADPAQASVGSWEAFCRNVTTLPLDDQSTFIRSTNAGSFGRGAGFVSSLGRITEEVQSCR